MAEPSKYDKLDGNPYEDYKQEYIAKGACGKVHKYSYRDDELAVKSILKKHRDAKLDYESEMDSFKEIGEHANIVKFLCTWEDSAWYYIAMEYCQGALSGLRQYKNDYTECDVQRIIKQMADALDYLHKKNISHRDIKPANVLVRSWSPLEVVLTDFNFSKRVKQEKNQRAIDQTVLETNLGTSVFKAPEVTWAEFRKRWKNENGNVRTAYNYKCDIWSLGVLMYNFLSGMISYPFELTEDELRALNEKWGTSKKRFEKEVGKLRKEVMQQETVSFKPTTAWLKVSSESKDLLNKMLVPFYRERCDYAYILNSDWLNMEIEHPVALIR